MFKRNKKTKPWGFGSWVRHLHHNNFRLEEKGRKGTYQSSSGDIHRREEDQNLVTFLESLSHYSSYCFWIIVHVVLADSMCECEIKSWMPEVASWVWRRWIQILLREIGREKEIRDSEFCRYKIEREIWWKMNLEEKKWNWRGIWFIAVIEVSFGLNWRLVRSKFSYENC